MKKNLLFLVFLVGYHFLFWQEGLGLNLTVFAVACVLLVYSNYKRETFTSLEILLASSLLLSAGAVVTINTSISILVLIFTSLSYVGYLSLRQSSVLESFINGFTSFFNPKHSLLPEPIFRERKKRPAGILYMRLAFVPLLIFVLYFILLSAGNSIFKSLSNSILGDFIQMLTDLSWNYIFFILLGLMIVRWVFVNKRKAYLELPHSSFLSRKDKKVPPSKRKLALKHEYLSGLMIFGSLNILFAIVNFIDVKWVWFGFHVPANFNLKEFVHEGVGWLIVSLLLSIVLVFYFFRYNLNFYPNNKWLKILGQIWIFQNAILAISVALRTSYYMGFHGLASGRIAVLVFLSMVIFGLISLSIKILQKRNTAFVLRVNSAFFIIVLTACSLVHWDKFIALHNLDHSMANEIDVNNYLDLNPQVYPLIYANLDKVEKQINSHNANEVRWISYTKIEDFKSALDRRAEKYLHKQSPYSIASWSYGEAKAVRLLREIL